MWLDVSGIVHETVAADRLRAVRGGGRPLDGYAQGMRSKA